MTPIRVGEGLRTSKLALALLSYPPSTRLTQCVLLAFYLSISTSNRVQKGLLTATRRHDVHSGSLGLRNARNARTWKRADKRRPTQWPLMLAANFVGWSKTWILAGQSMGEAAMGVWRDTSRAIGD